MEATPTMENPSVIPTAEPTSPAGESSRLRDEWIAFPDNTKLVLECVATEFIKGAYNFSNGKFAHRTIIGDDGKPRRMTLADLVAEKRGRDMPERETAVKHADRIVKWMQHKATQERLSDFADTMPRHRDCRFSSYVGTTEAQQEALEAMIAYCKAIKERVEAGHGIIFNGSVGTGKTHLLFAAARVAITAGYGVAYRNCQKLYSDFRSRMSAKKGPSEAGMIRQLVRPDVLILDDVISPHGEVTAYQEQMLYCITEGRYMAMRPTWVALNVATTEEAIQRIGAAIIDRWKEGALCLAFDWPSWRRPEGPGK